MRLCQARHRCRKCRSTFREGANTQSSCPKCGSDDIDRGQNPETQLIPLRDYAQNRQLVITKEYVDIGVSGTKDRRPELDQLMADAQRRRFDVLLVARFDRFARSTKHLVLALEQFQALGIDFISLSESIDTSTPMGRMVFTVIGAVAELERSLIRERVVMGLNRARKNGTTLGRRRVQVDAGAVRRLRAEGHSWTHIVRALGISRGAAQRAAMKSKPL
jgi:DNA invertase Pin-like site-specific DNA recombinase